VTNKRPLGEEQFFLLLAIFIGVVAGAAVVCFRVSIFWLRQWLLGSGLVPSYERRLIVPTVVGLLIAFLIVRFFPRARGSGVNQTKAAVYVYDGYIPFRTVIGKFVLSALAIGSGQSLGPEDPSLQVGAGIASAVGRRLKLSRERLRMISPLGAAAGLAAAFNAPISAVLFVIEEVIGRWSAGVLGAVILSAVSSVVVTHLLLGSAPLFQIPSFELVNVSELLAYAVLGVAGGVASVAFVKLVAFTRPRLKALPPWTQYIQPALGGLLVGIIGLRFPQVMGAGYEFIDQAMHGQYTWELLGLLAGLKILATGSSFVSGTPGGMFAPTLFMGAMLGGAVGQVEHLMFPHLSGSVGAYALVGMGVMFAGILRAPMTSVFMILEVSGSYAIIVPVMIANTLSYLISRSLQPVPIFDLLSRQDGIDLPSMEEWREESVLRVEDAMHPVNEPVLRTSDSVRDAWRHAADCNEDALLVTDDTGWWSWISRAQLASLAVNGSEGKVLLDVLEAEALPHLHPDHPIDTALKYSEMPVLPVVHRADYKQLVGIIRLKDAVEAFKRVSRTSPHSA
jgi:CIC family chloride channel protein